MVTVSLYSGGAWQSRDTLKRHANRSRAYIHAEEYIGLVVKHDLELPLTSTFPELLNLVRATLGLSNDKTFLLTYKAPGPIVGDPKAKFVRSNLVSERDFDTWMRY